MRKSKNRYFYHIFVSPGDAPGAITLNVVWMESEFDAYKLSCCMCPSNYNCFWDTSRYWSKIVNLLYPLALDAPVRGVPVGIAPPCLVRKNYNGLATTRWKNFEDIFIRFGATRERDRRTDRQTDRRTPHASNSRAMHSIARKKSIYVWNLVLPATKLAKVVKSNRKFYQQLKANSHFKTVQDMQ